MLGRRSTFELHLPAPRLVPSELQYSQFAVSYIFQVSILYNYWELLLTVVYSHLLFVSEEYIPWLFFKLTTCSLN